MGLPIMWDNSLLPLTVLYSPNLRLRYRCTWSTGSAQINQACHKLVFKTGIECDHTLARAIEVTLKDPPKGCVYVRDDESDTLDGSTIFIKDQIFIKGAIVRLPESEASPFLTLGVTLHEILHCLGFCHQEDPGSVMYPQAQVRPQLLADIDVFNLVKIYG